ncbi:uncharacterized protein N7515_009662 [Penicillium bovifimosum]|uniref:Alpha/beta hydrolase domain-containing protein n=1 Tax=Penicillium bovifimosum TaxID=126998 RepID=A0A9W9GHB1_9EURO|nr:uncharacterized protein N7515_009662 [Penicillium bovifimosum]KAJ5120274.1 hypothetical protein N7515_009662 [Penicillium bovifimosum]
MLDQGVIDELTFRWDPERITEPIVTFLPETKTSKIVTHDAQDGLLPVYNYVTREYMMGGIARGQWFCTRILLRCPADPQRFSGLVVEEPSHIWGGTSMWSLINRWLMRNGHAWLQVDSQAPAALDQIKKVDPERYKDMIFMDCASLSDFLDDIPNGVAGYEVWEHYYQFKFRWWAETTQSMDILAAASYALRLGEMGIEANRVILTGLCQTADVTRKFIEEGQSLRLNAGKRPFDGFLPCQSDGGLRLTDIPPSKVIEIQGETELLALKDNLWLERAKYDLYQRRDDSDYYRLYEVSGMPHRETRYLSMADKARLSGIEITNTQWTTFSKSFVFNAIFEAMDKWITAGIEPPQGARIVVNEDWEIQRDLHGNALAGVRTVHTDVPTATIIDVAPRSYPHWHIYTEVPFSDVHMWMSYKTVGNYRRQAGEAIERQIQNGFLLPEDAEILRRDTIEHVSF